jgi:hypothetical protein
VLIAIAAALLLMTAQAEQATAGSQHSPSADRLREKLDRPGLEIPPLPSLPTPTFRVTITETPPFPIESVLEVMWRGIAEQPTLPGGTFIPGRATSPTPLASVDLLQVWGAFARARHARTERLAKERISKEHAAFCLVNDCSAVEEGPPVTEGVLRAPAR